MEQKTKFIIAGVIIVILMLPAIFIGITTYFIFVILIGLIVGGIMGFTYFYRTLMKEL